jgi:hypothetical protein
VVLLVLFGAALAAPRAQATRIFVAPVAPAGSEAQGAAGDGAAAALTAAIEASVLKRIAGADVVTPRALDTQLELDLVRACRTGDDTSCVAELAEAMGVDLVLRPQLAVLGRRAILTLSLYDGARAALLGQAQRDTPRERPEELLEQVPDLVAEVGRAAGLRVITPRPKALPALALAELGAGGLLLLGAGAVHLFAFLAAEPAYQGAELSRDEARAWEVARPIAFAGPILGYLGGAALLGLGAFTLLAPEEP